MSQMNRIVNDLRTETYGAGEHVPTIGGRYQFHPAGLVGFLFRVVTPESIGIGDCPNVKGKLKPGDLIACMDHSGDCFQNYVMVQRHGEELRAVVGMEFGSYGNGDCQKVRKLTRVELAKLADQLENANEETR
jgi:hypothetical protein